MSARAMVQSASGFFCVGRKAESRLTNVSCGTAWGQTFTYDAWGNINKSGNSNFVGQGGTGNHVVGFGYDGRGDVNNDGIHTFAFDAEGRATFAAGATILVPRCPRFGPPLA